MGAHGSFQVGCSCSTILAKLSLLRVGDGKLRMCKKKSNCVQASSRERSCVLDSKRARKVSTCRRVQRCGQAHEGLDKLSSALNLTTSSTLLGSGLTLSCSDRKVSLTRYAAIQSARLQLDGRFLVPHVNRRLCASKTYTRQD